MRARKGVRPHLLRQWLAAGLAVLVGLAMGRLIEAQETDTPRERYDALLAGFDEGRALMGRDNLSGAIVWGEAYVLQSLLEMYRATEEVRYLSKFVAHADSVLALRDDRVGRVGWDARPKLGWSTGGSDTFGKPIVLEDSLGEPALEVRAVHWSNNHATRISVEAGGDGAGTYDLVVANDAGSEPYRERHANLTQESVEARVNRPLTVQRYIEVRRLGGRPPAPTPDPIPVTSEQVALTVFHNPFILMPLAWFGDLVRAEGLSQFRAAAARFLAAAEAGWSQADEHWEDHGSFGFYRVRPHVPFWASGLAAPVNVQAAHGLLSMHLASATADRRYHERTGQILELLRRITREAERGGHTIHYWIGEGYTGWGPPSGLPRPHGNAYARFGGRRVIEDASHGSWTVLLVHQATRRGLLDRSYTRGWVETARHMLPPDVVAEGGMPRRLPGIDAEAKSDRGAHDIVAPTWALMAAHGAQALHSRGLELFRSRYSEKRRSALVLLGWARLARLSAEMTVREASRRTDPR